MDSQGHDIQSPGAGRTVEGLAGRRILLGITGSIAAYKAAVLCRLLKCAGAEVRVVMTPLAKQFITPLTMATLSKNPILVEFFDPENGAWNSHVSLGEWADCYLIAPATANTLAKMACGIADNLLLTTYLSARCPVVVSPAMDLDMYAHPATQENLRRLAERGVRIVQPAEGELASGLTGKGRMAEPADIAAFVGQLFGGENPEKKKSLQGRRFVVTAGATIEAIDPVRFISNHSTGKMGYAIAGALAARGGDVTLVSGRTALPTPAGVQRTDVLSAAEMYDAATAAFDRADGAVMCAAVADFRKRKSKNAAAKCASPCAVRATSPPNWAHAKAAACWWASRSKPTTNRPTPKPSSPRKTSTSSSSTRCATPGPDSAATPTKSPSSTAAAGRNCP